jgi:hypothetical protein
MKYTKTFLLLVACSLPFMVLVVAGLSIYLANINEVAISLSEIFLPLAGLFLVISAILFLILFTFRRFPVVSGILTGLIVALSLAVWVQSQLLVWKFGQFNGQDIAWEKWNLSKFIDGAVWVVIIVVCLDIFIRRKQKVERALVTGLYFLGLVSVLFSFLNAPVKNAEKVDPSASRDIFSFHPKKNVLIILLDDFQSDYFYSLAEKYPGEIQELDGFTFYRNTISRFPTTKTSLPSIITGVPYRNEKPYQKYLADSYAHFNILQAYRAQSYSTNFVGQLVNIFPDIVSMEKVRNKTSYLYLYPVFEYLDFGVFRALPSFFKPAIFNHGNWFFTFRLRKKYPPGQHGADVRFLELFEGCATVDSKNKGTFKFLHFFIPHAPSRVNENLEFDPSLHGEKGYIRQTRGAIRLASRILIKLKKIGIYDQTEIIIMSDHGTGNLEALSRKADYNDAVSEIHPSVQSSSLALLLHKPANSKGNLKISDVPLELTDIACLLGLHTNDTVCSDFYSALEGKPRLRKYYYYEWQDEYWDSYNLPPMTEYIVSGPAYDPESYSLGEFTYTSQGKVANHSLPLPSYKLDRVIDFTTQGSGEADLYLRTGWSYPEPSQRWTDGPLAGLSFHFDKAPRNDLELRILGFGYLAKKKINSQVVTILANQVPIGRLLINDQKWYTAVIPKNLVSGQSLNLVFKISNPMLPSQEDSKSVDPRRLGIAVLRMVIKENK